MTSEVFFQPRAAWVGDLIPWVEGDTAHLFYLHEQRVSPKPGTPWYRVTTTDNVTFTDRGESLAAGGVSDSDFNAYTGSVVRDADGVLHLFYTGQNPRHLGADGRPLQIVMHATSADGMSSWQRHPEGAFGPPAGYETGDWRDPFVFRDEEAGIWRMLITARHTDGPERRRGTIAQFTSRDLSNWEPAEPFWDPRQYIAHECPEVFKMGDWWYLVYSEFSDAFVTRYRMARDLSGPWIAPEHDSIDGRAYYAAKSATLNGRRYFYGWIASRDGNNDSGPWQWAGTLSVVEATQRADGTLAFRPPSELFASFGSAAEAAFEPLRGLRLDSPSGFDAAVASEGLPTTCHVSATLDIVPGTRAAGLLIRASDDGDLGYQIRLEPSRQRVVFDRWPRRITGTEQWQISGDIPFEVELERPCDLQAGLHRVDVIIDKDICVVCIDDSVMLSTRIYDHESGRLGIFVSDGAVTLTELTVGVRTARDEVGASQDGRALEDEHPLVRPVPTGVGAATGNTEPTN